VNTVDASASTPKASLASAAEAPNCLPRWVAGLQALLVSGVPTQILVFSLLFFVVGLTYRGADGEISFAFFITLSLVDTLMVALLIQTFLRQSGESLRQVFLGRRPVRPDVIRGLALIPVVVLLVAAVVLAVRTVFPWMHTVETNPLEALMRTPLQAAIFVVVAVVAGGVREELQRAFILHRFDQRLGGIRLGLVLFTVLFGVLHLEQGADVAVAIGCLGLWWGILYIRHRSSVMPMVNHAGFNAVQVVQSVLVKTFGG
jgi:membrane protease YdiL (CAAX protease family)